MDKKYSIILGNESNPNRKFVLTASDFSLNPNRSWGIKFCKLKFAELEPELNP